MEHLTQENISIVLSLIALVVSVASPFVAYYYLVPQMQEFQNRPTLAVNVYNQPEFVPAKSGVANSTPQTVPYTTVLISNEGNLPAKNIQVVFCYTSLDDGETPPLLVTADPPMSLESTIEGTDIRVMIKTPLAPDDSAKIMPRLIPDEVWVYTEYGERQTFYQTMETGRTPRIDPRRGAIICPVR